MTRSLVVASVFLLASVPCLAQGGSAAPSSAAPARHANKVTDAATAAFERMEKAMYRPVSAGLKELGGTLEMKMDMPEMEGAGMAGMPDMGCSYAVAFKAPAELKITVAKGADGPMAMMATGMKKAAEGLLRVSLGLGKPGDEDEFDADAKTVDKKTVLTIVRYEKNVETSRHAMTLDDLGRIESTTATMKGGQPGGRDETATVQYTWAKEGDRWLLQKMTSTGGMMSFAIVPAYVDAGGFKLVSSFAMKGEGEMEMTLGFRFAELTVNGKKVDVPAAKGAAGAK